MMLQETIDYSELVMCMTILKRIIYLVNVYFYVVHLLSITTSAILIPRLLVQKQVRICGKNVFAKIKKLNKIQSFVKDTCSTVFSTARSM